uniref:Retrotransposon gag domain-containing protein n=1 Tax=Magallana gigas TaxID=29159 RepID=A0A8W8J6G0_MAGGI
MKANRPLNYNLRNRTPSFLTLPEDTETGQHSQSSTAESQQQPTLDNAAAHQETGADHPLVETEEQIHLSETNLLAEDVQVHFNEPAITEEADPQTENSENIPAEDTEHQHIDSRDAERTEDQQFSEQLYIKGSAGTWFQTINPGQFQNLQGFKDLLSERFKPSAHKTAMLSIKQEPNETCEQYLERAERLALTHHDLDEAYKVQFIANGLNTNLRGRVLAREPQTFQALRKDISLVQLELGCDQNVSFMTPNTSLDMTELSRSINSHIEQTVSTQINALADRLQEAQHFDRRREEERRDQYRDNSRGQHERYRDTYRGQHERYRDDSRGRHEQYRDDSRDRHNQYSDTTRGRYKSPYRDTQEGIIMVSF